MATINIQEATKNADNFVIDSTVKKFGRELYENAKITIPKNAAIVADDNVIYKDINGKTVFEGYIEKVVQSEYTMLDCVSHAKNFSKVLVTGKWIAETPQSILKKVITENTSFTFESNITELRVTSYIAKYKSIRDIIKDLTELLKCRWHVEGKKFFLNSPSSITSPLALDETSSINTLNGFHSDASNVIDSVYVEGKHIKVPEIELFTGDNVKKTFVLAHAADNIVVEHPVGGVVAKSQWSYNPISNAITFLIAPSDDVNEIKISYEYSIIKSVSINTNFTGSDIRQKALYLPDVDSHTTLSSVGNEYLDNHSDPERSTALTIGNYDDYFKLKVNNDLRYTYKSINNTFIIKSITRSFGKNQAIQVAISDKDYFNHFYQKEISDRLIALENRDQGADIDVTSGNLVRNNIFVNIGHTFVYETTSLLGRIFWNSKYFWNREKSWDGNDLAPVRVTGAFGNASMNILMESVASVETESIIGRDRWDSSISWNRERSWRGEDIPALLPNVDTRQYIFRTVIGHTTEIITKDYTGYDRWSSAINWDRTKTWVGGNVPPINSQTDTDDGSLSVGVATSLLAETKDYTGFSRFSSAINWDSSKLDIFIKY
jgi:hypothetical protein